MNKYMLVRLVSKELGKPMSEVLPVVGTLFEQMAATILDGEKVTIASLGTFSLKERPQHRRYDPYHKVPIVVPAGKAVRFAVSPSLQRQVHERYDAVLQSDAEAVVCEL